MLTITLDHDADQITLATDDPPGRLREPRRIASQVRDMQATQVLLTELLHALDRRQYGEGVTLRRSSDGETRTIAEW